MSQPMDLYDRFSRLYLGVVYDALRFDLKVARPFVVHRAIKPLPYLPAGSVLFGHAFTCLGRRVADPDHLDDTVRIRMFQEFTDGCVQVIDTGQDDSVAHFGDISGKIARRFGARGAVIDGYTRDARILDADGFPVFCRGTQPTDAYGRWQIIQYQVPIQLSGAEGPVCVHPGDFLFGDPDGVLVIPSTLVEQVAGLAENRLVREDQVRLELLTTQDVQALYDRIGRW